VIRLVGIVLVIWGLIFQPLVMSMPVKMANHGSDTIVTFNVDPAAHVDEHTSHHGKKAGNETDGAHHQENGSIGDLTSHANDDCENDCLSAGNCCGVCAASLNHQAIKFAELQISTPIVGNAEHLVLGVLSSIFHPPKLS